MPPATLSTIDLLTEAESLQNLLVSTATGAAEDGGEFLRLRHRVLGDPAFAARAPKFLHTCRTLPQFWQFIKEKFGTYAERRKYLWDEFRPLLEALERGQRAPSDELAALAFERFDAAQIQAAWSKALERRASDPEGAITMARTLLESVCKHILDAALIAYEDSADLNKLYRMTAEALKLAPTQHTEQVFKQILGGCTSVVEGLGALRNRLSDAHGKGRTGVRPGARHAELAVNLSGALATFLLGTWEARTEEPKGGIAVAQPRVPQ